MEHSARGRPRRLDEHGQTETLPPGAKPTSWACSERYAVSSPKPAFHLSTTDAARHAVAQLRVEQSSAVMFVQSGSCCAGSLPMCFPEGQFMIGAVDVLLGDVDGCPFFIDHRLLQAWHPTSLELDVTRGEPEGFSLPAGPGLIFVTRRRSTDPTPDRLQVRHPTAAAVSAAETQ